MQQTVAKLQNDHAALVEQNRQGGIVDTPIKGQKLSDQVYEVTEGKKYVPDGKGGVTVLSPGQRFRPTEQAVRTGALRNKARELTESEMSGVRGTGRVFAGADIGVRKELGAISMTPKALDTAAKAGLTPADFVGLKPEGADGFTKAQVDEIIAKRQS